MAPLPKIKLTKKCLKVIKKPFPLLTLKVAGSRYARYPESNTLIVEHDIITDMLGTLNAGQCNDTDHPSKDKAF
jgi:hypothetical protein